MFSPKQQSPIVSRTISSPTGKRAQPAEKYDVSRFGNRGVIQKTEDYDYAKNNPTDAVMHYQRNYGNNLGSYFGLIYFTDYQQGGTMSSGFSGCYMAAFQFLDKSLNSPGSKLRFSDDSGNLTGVPSDLDTTRVFIAHVWYSEKAHDSALYRFGQLIEDGYIKVLAMFRPYDETRDQESMNQDLASYYASLERYNPYFGQNYYPPREMRIKGLIGRMLIDQTNDGRLQISADTFRQFKDESSSSSPYMNGIASDCFMWQFSQYSSQSLKLQTYYYQGYLGITGVVFPPDDLSLPRAYAKGIEDCGRTNPGIFLDLSNYALLNQRQRSEFFSGFSEHRKELRNLDESWKKSELRSADQSSVKYIKLYENNEPGKEKEYSKTFKNCWIKEPGLFINFSNRFFRLDDNCQKSFIMGFKEYLKLTEGTPENLFPVVKTKTPSSDDLMGLWRM